MEDVVWYRKPLLSEPVAILAFEGWSDAGNTATGCIENLCSTKFLENEPNYGFQDYPDIAGSINKYLGK